MKQVRGVTLSMLTVLLCSLLSQTQQSAATAPPPSTVTGSGTTNYIPIWTSSTALGNSKLYQTGGKVGVGTTTPAYALDVNGYINTDAVYSIGGSIVLAEPGGASYANTALGYLAMQENSTGAQNTASGYEALGLNSSGNDNTADGFFALQANKTGSDNTAVGVSALSFNASGNYNTAIGTAALYNNTTDSNTAIGYAALLSNTIGYDNTAIGLGALESNSSGLLNIAIGYHAATGVSAGNSYNIHIGSSGNSSDNGTIRIGTSGTQTSLFVAGVRGVITGDSNAVPVVIDSNGQLGTVSSSRRFKTDIQDMGDASRDLMRLRPVTFRYRRPFADGSQPIQYGLIAEEVAEVYPDLVAYSADGQIETVKYQLLDPMLLNEVQRQQAEIRDLQERLNRIESALAQPLAGAQPK